MKHFIHALSHLIFWVWNLTFIGLMYIWCLPQIGFELWLAATNGEVEPTFIVSFAALMIVPLVSTLLGFFRLRKYPILLMRLFYGVEAPLFTLCLLRLFMIRELTVASGFTLGLAGVAIAMFALELVCGYCAYRPRLAVLQMIAHSLILLVGLYLGTLLLLYSVPALATATVGFFTAFFRFDWITRINGWSFHPLILISSFLGISSALVFFSMPYLLVNFYLRAWARIRSAFGKQHSQEASWAITGMTLAISGLLFVGLQSQPQLKAFDLLTPPPANAAELKPAELLAIHKTQLQNADTIKAGLTNAYLSRYRYLSPWSRSNALADFYGQAFNLPGEQAKVFKNRIQTLHNGLLSPFLYRGEEADIEKAAQLYAQFFDEPIQQGERLAIRQALQATANRDETKAGLLNLDQKVVRLASQAVTVNAQGDWATVEIHEQYENLTTEDQEIFYTFSLPESAAITGLWLGDADSPKLFSFVVSPRGAAQQVYNAEVERAKFQQATDPALLEQVGPRQYRLRVFPIPAATPADRNKPTVPGNLHLWMTYQVMQQAEQWPLPQLIEKRNIYWTKETEHLRSNHAIALAEETWFEAAVPAQKAKATAHTIDLAEGYRVTAAPLTAKEQQLSVGKQIAVVIDSSYSMTAHVEALKQAVRDLKAAAKQNTLDFYVTQAGGTQASPAAAATPTVDVDKLLFYGSFQPADILEQFARSRQKPLYDALLLLTDKGSYELSKNPTKNSTPDPVQDQATDRTQDWTQDQPPNQAQDQPPNQAQDQTPDQSQLPEIGFPLWIVHVDGKLPSAYADDLLQQLQASRGGVETSVIKALQKVALAAADVVAVDGYTWQVAPQTAQTTAPDSPQVTAAAGAQPFEPLAARQLIAQQSRTLDARQVAALDGIHAIAKRTGLVTPYSSMLVLVDERQREALKQAEAGADRFDREVETGQDDLTNPNNPLTASVPEPSQVLSLLVGAIALVMLKRRPTYQSTSASTSVSPTIR